MTDKQVREKELETGEEILLPDEGGEGASAPGLSVDKGAEAHVAGEEPAEEEEKNPNRKWYVIHSYSGYEQKVKKNLEHRVESMGIKDKVFKIIVPTEEAIEFKNGQKRVVERRIFPGYILVEMILDEESWYVVRNTPGVTGFVGMGDKPTPLSQEEVDRIMKRLESEEPVFKVNIGVGDKVRITEGPFAEFTGTVDEIYAEKGKARVRVSFFGRETPVEVELLQLERI